MRIRIALSLMAAAACLLSIHAHGGQPQRLPEILIPIRMPGDPPIPLPALAAESGLPLTWEVATGPATLSGNVVTLTGGLGPVTLKATQAGDATWDPLVGHVCFSVTEEGGFTQVCRRLTNTDDGSTYGLTRTGRIAGYGARFESQLRDFPLFSRPGKRWREIGTGMNFLLHAIAEDGSLWLWPQGFRNAPTDPFGDASDPVRIGTEQDWSKVATGDSLRLALKTDGSLWRWETTNLQPVAPVLIGSRFSDWQDLSMSQSNQNMVWRSGGELYRVQSFSDPSSPTDGTQWKTASISLGGMVGLKQDGTLWTIRTPFGPSEGLSSDTQWISVAALRRAYMALRQDGTIWSGDLNNGSTLIKPPALNSTKTRWTQLSAGIIYLASLSRDGAIWNRILHPDIKPNTGPNTDGGFTRIAPAFYPQALDFMVSREQPFPVVAGSRLVIPEAALNSKLPLELTVVSGLSEVSGQGISFTGPGLVEVNFRQEGNATWGAFNERRTFLSQSAGPEIAVHDGTSANNPPRRDQGAVVNLGRRTKADMAAGLVRSFVLSNTGTVPLNITGVTSEAAGPLTFTTSFSPAPLAPGATVALELTLHASEYGTHQLTVIIRSDDADEPAYRIPFQIELANTPPFASTGPDRQIHAGSPIRLDGSFFSRDLEQAAATLTYAWDLDGNGYHTGGAVQEITLSSPGQILTAKLRVTDRDGATAFSQCIIAAVAPGMEIPTAFRLDGDSRPEIVFRGQPGRLYRLLYSWDLVRWEREDGSTSQKLPPMVCRPDGFFISKPWVDYGSRTFYRAVEVAE